MSRRLYTIKNLSSWQTYDIEEVCRIFKLHKQTVRSWIKQGLKTIDKGRPTLIHGSNLIEYLQEQNSRGKCSLEFDQFFCMKCKDACYAYRNYIAVNDKERVLYVKAKCRECKTTMCKSYQLAAFPKLRKMFRVVDVSELDDCVVSTFKTHIEESLEISADESLQYDIFNQDSGESYNGYPIQLH